MTMKAINATELKAHLSRYLRLASRGTRITVKDRDEPVAELGPPPAAQLSWPDRLAREGRLRPGTQDWTELRITPLRRRVDIQASLRVVRADPREVRRR
jgi:antitoxin (DNA-binding transcriptional repressor) of toxin-antitoxin stability system